ncbi:MAG: hypothetical protein IJ119_16435, partial [Clostridia bacterium]|nr:hypothetical protein [Clostridia bacterium]
LWAAFTPPALRYPSLCAFVPVPSSYPLSGLLLLSFRASAPTFTIAYNTMEHVRPAYIAFNHLFGAMVCPLYLAFCCQYSDFVNLHHATFLVALDL